MEQANPISPVVSSERIFSLDVLRGFALLGILLMNIQAFSMVDSAYLNPTAYGDFSGINYAVWLLCHIFADMKFMSLFSLLFGAGIILMTKHIQAEHRMPVYFYYRRIFILLLIGLFHILFIWRGDILTTYALCALLLYWVRNFRARWLITMGIVILCIPSVLYLLFGLSIPYMPKEAIVGLKETWIPSDYAIQEQLTIFHGSYMGQLEYRFEMFIFYFFVMLILLFWRAAGLMLIGMAFYKLRILSNEKSTRFYWIMLLICLCVALPLILYGVIRNTQEGWRMEYSFFLGFQWNYWGSLFMSGAYLAALMLMCKNINLRKFLYPLSLVGRMALTNYLLQSIICTIIFYGFGFGLFGYLERWQQILVVLGVWFFEIVLSLVWLNYFRFGPFEWLWRSITYCRLQPIINRDMKFNSPPFSRGEG